MGSNLAHTLLQKGSKVWVLDNLQDNLGGNRNNLDSEYLDKFWLNKDISKSNVFDDIDIDYRAGSRHRRIWHKIVQALS